MIEKNQMLEESLELIRANMSKSGKKDDKIPSFRTSFGVNCTFSPSENLFSDFYVNVINFIKEDVKKFKKVKKNFEYSEYSKYGLPFMEIIGKKSRVPIMFDLLFRFNEHDDSQNYFSDNFIPIICQKAQEVILDSLDISNDEPILHCFALKSDPWLDSSEKHQRIRIIFPGTYVDTKILNGPILNGLISDLKKNTEIFNELSSIPISSDWKEIFQKLTDSVPMYGCKRTQIENTCLLHAIYDDSLLEFSPENDDPFSYEIDLNDTVFEVSDCSLAKCGILEEEHYSEIKKKYSLPIILSINYPMKHSRYNEKILTISVEESGKKKEKEQKQGFAKKESQQEMFEELIPMISSKRFKKKYFWYDLGRCCFNIFKGSKAGFTRFYDLSPKRYKPLAEKFWFSMEREFLNCITLMEYARQDNPDVFDTWLKAGCDFLIQECIKTKGKNIPMAKLVKKFLCMDYVYNREEKTWYKKEGAPLIKDLGGLQLGDDISDILTEIFYEERKKRSEEKDKSSGYEEKKVRQAGIKDVDTVIDKLQDINYIESIIKALRSRLFDDNLSKYKDENLKTLACTNVVLEVYDNEICHRPGKLQDYITKSTNIPFPLSYTDSHHKVKFLEKYYGQVHTDEEMCYFFKKDMASYLEGGNPEKFFRNFIGPRNASKSKVIELLQLALGEYCVDLPSDSITLNKYKTSSSPCPELEQAKGARLAIVMETGKAEPLSVNKIKKFTGNDRYWNRTLNKEGGSRALTFKLIHTSNVIASVPDADKAYYCREVIYPFVSEWVKNPPKSKEEQYTQRKFKMDTNFSNTVKTLGQAQLYLMFKYFPLYKKEGVKRLPKIVRDETKKHHRDIDPYYNFIGEKIERIYNFPDDKTESKLRRKKQKKEESDEESVYESDFEDEIEDSDREEEMTKEERRTELSKYLDKDYKTSTIDVFSAYTKWYSKFCPDVTLNLTQSDFVSEMKRPDRLGAIKKGNWIGLRLRRTRRTQ